MRHPTTWTLLALLATGCSLPDKQIGDSSTTTDADTADTTDATLETTETTDATLETTGASETDTGEDCPGCGQACDMLVQDCPEGLKCAAHSDTDTWPDSAICVPVLGDSEVGEPCTFDGWSASTDDCGATSFCMANEDGEGVCRAICTGEEPDDFGDCDETGTLCTRRADESPGPLAVCLPWCDPLIVPSDECEAGEGCYRYGSYDFDHFGGYLCLPVVSAAAIGEPCGQYNNCEPGASCLAAAFIPGCEGVRCCTPFCSLQNPDCTSMPGTDCVESYLPSTPPPFIPDDGICADPDVVYP